MIDFKKDPTYKANANPRVLEVPEYNFLMVDGQGAPDSSDTASNEFQTAMEVIFGIIYTIKFWDKKFSSPVGFEKFSMAPIESLWWTRSGNMLDLSIADEWRWQAMLRVPDFVTQAYFELVVSEIRARNNSDIYLKARLERFAEGTCVQLLHIGPYDQEYDNIVRLHYFAITEGYALRGKHHELYFSDPRRTAPEKLKTIIRQPVSR